MRPLGPITTSAEPDLRDPADNVPYPQSPEPTVSIVSGSLPPGVVLGHTGCLSLRDVYCAILSGSTNGSSTYTATLRITTGGLSGDVQLMLTYGGDAPLAFVQAIAPAEAGAWLSVTPSAGSVLPGGGLALDVHAQPAGLAAGVHRAALHLEFADG